MARTPSTEDVYEGDGVTAVFQFHFPFLHDTDVFVSVDDANVSFTILPGSTAQVQLTVPPADGTIVRVYRSTLAYVPEHLFASGVPFLPRYVDENNRQLLYASQEAINDTAVTAAEALVVAEEAKQIAQEAEDKIDGAIIDSSFQLRQDLGTSVLDDPLKGTAILGLQAHGLQQGLSATVVEDVTLRIQVALNSYGICRLPPGNFKISNTITLGSSNAVIGSGMGRTRLFRDTAVANFDMFVGVSKTDLRIQDLWLDAVQKETVTDGTMRRSAIRLWDNDTGVTCQRIRIQGVRFSKFTSAESQAEGRRGVVSLQKCTDVEVVNCSFDDNRATAIFWWDSDDVRVLDNVYLGEQLPYDPFGRVGSFTSGWANGTTVQGNRCTGSGYTMINVSGSGLNVIGNDIDSPGYSGITIAELVPAATGVVVSENNIRNPGLDGISSCEVDGFAYTGNTISGASTAGRGGIYFFSTISGSCSKNGKVTANNISGCASGIRMQGGVSIDVSSNRIARNVVGMLVSNRITATLLAYVRGNLFEDNTTYAAQFGDTSATNPAIIELIDNEFTTTDISNFQATGIVTQHASTTLRLGINTWHPSYSTLGVETAFAARATKAFLNLAGTLLTMKRTNGVPKGAVTAYAGTASLATGAGVNIAVTVTGAVVGEKVVLSEDAAFPNGVQREGHVTAANTVTLRYQNVSGSTVALPACNITVNVLQEV